MSAENNTRVLNRREKRALKTSIIIARKEASKIKHPQDGTLIPEGQILAQEDDIRLLIGEEGLYRSAQAYPTGNKCLQCASPVRSSRCHLQGGNYRPQSYWYSGFRKRNI